MAQLLIFEWGGWRFWPRRAVEGCAAPGPCALDDLGTTRHAEGSRFVCLFVSGSDGRGLAHCASVTAGPTLLSLSIGHGSRRTGTGHKPHGVADHML